MRLVMVTLLCAGVFAVLGSVAEGETCDCLPDLPSNSSGRGLCTRTQDGRRWCKLEWNAEGNSSPQAAEEELRKRNVTPPDVGGEPPTKIEKAALFLNRVKPGPDYEKRGAQAYAALLAAAVVRNAPDRFDLIPAFYKRFLDGKSESLFIDAASSPQKLTLVTETKRTYNILLAFGCAALREEAFSIVIKTRFAPAKSECDE